MIACMGVCADDCSTRVKRDLLDDGVPDTLVSIPSAEREGERLHAGVQKLNLELSFRDRSRLSNQLIQPLLGDRAVSLLVEIGPMSCAPRLSVDEHSKRYSPSPRDRSDNEVEIPFVERLIGTMRRNSSIRCCSGMPTILSDSLPNSMRTTTQHAATPHWTATRR
jgi:hypothetical protein